MRMKRLAVLFATLLATGLIATGCGDDDDGGDGGGDGAQPAITVNTEDLPTTSEEVEDAQDQAYEACKDSIEDVPDEQKDAAEQACESLKPQ
jgi:hypothetical protein